MASMIMISSPHLDRPDIVIVGNMPDVFFQSASLFLDEVTPLVLQSTFIINWLGVFICHICMRAQQEPGFLTTGYLSVNFIHYCPFICGAELIALVVFGLLAIALGILLEVPSLMRG